MKGREVDGRNGRGGMGGDEKGIWERRKEREGRRGEEGKGRMTRGKT